MGEFTKPQSERDFERNFEPIKPAMNATEAYYESSRCLFCYDAPCISACPTEIDIPLFIRQINSNNVPGAAKTIYESNIFGHACGKVCPTEVLCEGACVYNHQDVKPIEIGRLQSYATTQAIHQGLSVFSAAPSNGKKVAVIGAGPAGISCAAHLRLHGVEVVVFEAKEKPSGLTVYGVAPYKLTNEEAMDEVAFLQKQLDFEIRYNHLIATKEDLEFLEKDYDAIFLGIGLGATSDLNIEGEDLDHCIGAVEFVEQLRMRHHQMAVPEKVIILGGGNTAMDAASECARMGASEVILAYRRTKDQMPAYWFEYELAKSVGVRSLFGVAPVEIVGNGKSKGIKFVKTTVAQGKVVPVEGSEFFEPCDWVVKATGQSKAVEWLSMIEGLQLAKDGTITVGHTFQTTNPNYFAAGDAVSGGQEVVNAVADGRKAAMGIIEALR